MPRNVLKSTLNLSRLPKARSNVKSLNYKGTTPGEAAPFFNRLWDRRAYHPKDPAFFKQLIDIPRTSPFRPWNLPTVETSTFVLRVIPKRLLSERQDTNALVCRSKKGRVDMSIFTTVPKKVHKHGAIRSKIRSRLKAALGLLVTRSGFKDTSGSSLSSVDADIDPDKWILADWTYVVFPNLALYRRPMPELIDDFRTALKELKEKAELWEARLENLSSLTSLTTQNGSGKPGPSKKKKQEISGWHLLATKSGHSDQFEEHPLAQQKHIDEPTTRVRAQPQTQRIKPTPDSDINAPNSQLPKWRSLGKRQKPWQPPPSTDEPEPPTTAKVDQKSLASLMEILGNASSKTKTKGPVAGSPESKLFRSNILVVPPKDSGRK